ncbi:MAG: hypothetical protein ACK2UY_13155 [Anaerolineae bacterium]|jgi:Ca2+/Na+ antiporter
MIDKTAFSAAKSTARIFGILAGLGGLTHGIGEVLQGNVKPEGIIINSWAQGPIATHMGGEPGMTLVPNLLVTGILNIVVSLTVVIWAAFVHDRKSGRILLLLSVLMLLVGGGFGPPILGILAGVAGMGIDTPSSWWQKRLSRKGWHRLGRLWPGMFGIAAINGVFLVVGSVVLVYLFDYDNADLFTNSFFFSVVSLAVTIWVGRGHDLQSREPRAAAAPAPAHSS